MADDLTFQQIYEVPVEVTFADTEEGLRVQYAGCGSHELKATGTVSLQEARALRDRLSALPGIDSEEATRG